MIVQEKLQILADHEHVEQFFVDDLEFLDGPVLPGIAHHELEIRRLVRLQELRRNVQVERIFGGIGNTRHQLHAAALANAFDVGANVGVHGAHEHLLLSVKHGRCCDQQSHHGEQSRPLGHNVLHLMDITNSDLSRPRPRSAMRSKSRACKFSRSRCRGGRVVINYETGTQAADESMSNSVRYL